jgi:GGDEF domain-containing protein
MIWPRPRRHEPELIQIPRANCHCAGAARNAPDVEAQRVPKRARHGALHDALTLLPTGEYLHARLEQTLWRHDAGEDEFTPFIRFEFIDEH